jgi:capsular polysaccharide biosynthesis protein
MEIIKQEHLSLRTKPINLDSKDESLFSYQYSKKIKAATIEKVNNVDILNDIIFNKSNVKLYTKYTHVNKHFKFNMLKRFKLYLGSYNKIDKGIWIIDNWSYGYFHWLTDALTRLVASEEHISNHVVLLPIKFEKSLYKDSLQMLNFEVRFFNPRQRLFVKELLMPSHTAPTGNYNKEIINKVRDRFNQNITEKPFRKIYISRQKAKYRKITNENEVVTLLKSYNFEIHYFEDYEFFDQVILMQQTSHLIGLHGAGLTNMLFMPKNGKIVELRNKDDDHNNCYYTLASDLEHKYYYLLNEGDNNDTHFVNISVNIENLTKIIELIV